MSDHRGRAFPYPAHDEVLPGDGHPMMRSSRAAGLSWALLFTRALDDPDYIVDARDATDRQDPHRLVAAYKA